MPVRVTIHSSDVSTVFSSSALLSTVSGTAAPVPAITALRIFSFLPSGGSDRQPRFGFGERSDLLCDLLVHPAVDELPREPDGVLDRLRRGPSVADDHALARPEQRGTSVFSVVDALLESAEGRPHQDEPEAVPPGASDLLLQRRAEILDEALAHLQRDVPREAVGHDDVHAARIEIVPLDV